MVAGIQLRRVEIVKSTNRYVSGRAYKSLINGNLRFVTAGGLVAGALR